ncbi:monothiol glutaredoxin-S10-like [Impatiens glandulifera]|uniref:monothiol glutaredoxin-S10-like n=1 Tax=Impatiens glandulifera TaxID=253017 RepID=UPI001FB06789|nr:monothiol glutaredoxin-S10-like [Impatiens glandulifera]
MAGSSILPMTVVLISPSSSSSSAVRSHLSQSTVSLLPSRCDSRDQFVLSSSSCRNSRLRLQEGDRKLPSFRITSMAATFGSRLKETVKKTVDDNPVVVYSKSWCSYSSEVKTLFRRLGIEPLVIELDELGAQGPQLQKMLLRITGQHTVPNVFVGGKHIGGCTDTVKLYHKGELQALLLDVCAKNSSQS